MKPEAETQILPLIRETNIVGDDRYLTEMTERLRKLRALIGEQEDRKGRPKRWLGRYDPSGGF
ncbi:MAG: hypothetical protein ABJM29_04600 [Rhizobiaceae bacterium]